MSKDLRRKKLKKRKILKKIGLSILAGFMFCMPVMSAACTPLLALPEQESQEANYDLGLNPETDPVVFTTQSGLEIKKSNGYISGSVTATTNRGTNYTQDLSGFYYMTMGSYSGTIYTYASGSKTASFTVTNEPVNWIIIGRGEFDFYDSTPAGGAIATDSNKQEFAVTNNLYLPLAMQSIPHNDEIPEGCMLVYSEKLLGEMYFNSSGSINNAVITTYSPTYFGCASGYYGNRYRYYANSSGSAPTWTTSGNAGGSLYNYINNLFSKSTTGTILKNSLGFSQNESDLIVPQQLYTHYSNASSSLQESPSTDGNTFYTMFPLAYKAINTSIKQNFCIEDYLPNASQRMASLIGSTQLYWYATRSGQLAGDSSRYICDVQPNGSFLGSDARWVDNVGGVRPAMVMKLQ